MTRKTAYEILFDTGTKTKASKQEKRKTTQEDWFCDSSAITKFYTDLALKQGYETVSYFNGIKHRRPKQ